MSRKTYWQVLVLSFLSLTFNFSYSLNRDNYSYTLPHNDGVHEICDCCDEAAEVLQPSGLVNFDEKISDFYDLIPNKYYEFKYKKQTLPHYMKPEHISHHHYQCGLCGEEAIYKGYLDPCLNRYFHCFKKYLKYVRSNTECKCYWPELSVEAAQLNDYAYNLFRDLLESTALKKICSSGYSFDELIYNNSKNVPKNRNLTTFFYQIPKEGFDEKTAAIVFVNHNFFFSNYFHVCQDLYAYSQKNFHSHNCAEIKNKLDNILEKLASKFIKLYEHCYSKHPHKKIEAEIYFINSLLGFDNYNCVSHGNNDDDLNLDLCCNTNLNQENSKWSKCNDTICHAYECTGVYENNLISDFVKDEIRQNDFEFQAFNYNPQFPSVNNELKLMQGITLNEHLAYKHAISLFSKLIKSKPVNKISYTAYIERAIAYFEIGEIELALKDYKAAKKLIKLNPFPIDDNINNLFFSHHIDSTIYIPKDKIQFAKGLVLGTRKGIQVSATEFIPSTLSSLRGLGQGLWALVNSPIHMSKEFINDVCACVDYVRTHSTKEIIQDLVPEIQELILQWKNTNDHEKGTQIGFIIGKYGIEIFACSGVMKAVQRYRALKHGNAMFTLQTLAESKANRAIILEKAAERWKVREKVLKNGNLKIHWDKQNKHVPGKHNYADGKSIFEHPDPQNLINKWAGTGKRFNNDIPGTAGYREVVDFSEHIGIWKNKENTLSLPTTRGTIHYSKEGVHIVPAQPK